MGTVALSSSISRPWLGLRVVPTNRAVPPQAGSSTARKAASSDSGSEVSRTVRFTTSTYTLPGTLQDPAEGLEAFEVMAGQEHVAMRQGGGHAAGQPLGTGGG